ncbi:MAG TPA: SDR family oxidoreductase [Trebonia sp.]|nr:SDR family oxidoreductase [Trebonia sp.]
MIPSLPRRQEPTDLGVAVVTGGARGIGQGVAQEMVRRGYYTVVIDNGTSLDGMGSDDSSLAEAEAALTGSGQRGEVVTCDVRDPQATRGAISDVMRRHGSVEVLVNMAGILRPGAFLEDTAETWDLVLSTHVAGHVNLINAVLPAMLYRKRGVIVNCTSTAALLGSMRQPAYSAAKEAIIGLTRYLASRLASDGITVNAVSPSAYTRMGTPSAEQPSAPEPEAVKRNPGLARREPSDVGRFAGWLTEPQCAELTGRIFHVAGKYVIEYEHLRAWKWAAVAPPGGVYEVEESLRWVIGRPHPTVIGPWPAHDFRLQDIERLWEGTSAGPDLAAGARRKSAEAASDAPVAVIGDYADGALDLIAKDVGPLIRDGDRPAGVRPYEVSSLPPDAGARPARGAIVFRGKTTPREYPSHDVAASLLPDPSIACGKLASMLSDVQSAIRAAHGHVNGSVVVVLAGDTPWNSDRPDALNWLTWYGTIGLIRGVAATESIYGVRVNGLIAGSANDGLIGPALCYLLSSGSSWLNGYLLAVAEDGVGLMADERPRWQSYSDGPGFALPDFLRQEIRAISAEIVEPG